MLLIFLLYSRAPFLYLSLSFRKTAAVAAGIGGAVNGKRKFIAGARIKYLREIKTKALLSVKKEKRERERERGREARTVVVVVGKTLVRLSQLFGPARAAKYKHCIYWSLKIPVPNLFPHDKDISRRVTLVIVFPTGAYFVILFIRGL